MWSQTYDPLNAPVLSALVAASPIILFLLNLHFITRKNLDVVHSHLTGNMSGDINTIL